MHYIPTLTRLNTQVMSYADDLTVMTQHPKHEIAAENMQDYMHTLEDWLTTNRMSVSTHKSSLTLITPCHSEYNIHPQVTLNNSDIPCSNTFKILGVTIDKGMTFKQHTDNINTAAKIRSFGLSPTPRMDTPRRTSQLCTDSTLGPS